MKWSFVSSLLCLAAGFFLGHNASPPSPDLSQPSITRSSRAPRTASQSRPHSLSQNTVSDFTAPNFSELSEERQALFTAKLHGSLATLSLDQIPAARDALLEKERLENDNDPPWEISEEMLILLSRWYELEGESVLSWISQSQEWRPHEISKAKLLTILSGFHLNPDRAMSLVLDLKASLETSNDPFDSSNFNFSQYHEDILYEIGRWSDQPLEMLRKIDPEGDFQIVYESSTMPLETGPRAPRKLSLGMGFPVTQASPTSYSQNSEMEALARGLIDAGKHDLARDFLRGLEGGAKEAFQEVLTDEAAKQGWQEVKHQIDNGVLDLTALHDSEVLSELAKTNRQAALDWYLNLPKPEGVTREYQIAEAVTSSGAFQIPLPPSDDPFADNEEMDFSAALNWLKEMQSRGEPVEKAAGILHYEAVRRREWQTLKDLHQSFLTENLQYLEQDIIHTAINPEQQTILGETFTWSELSDSTDLSAAEAFGLVDQVHAKARETNAQSRAALRALLERLEAEAGE